MGRLRPQPQTVPASISAKSSMKLSRPGGGLVLHSTEVPQQTERGRSIATKTRCPPDVRSSLNFRHNVAGARRTLRAITGLLHRTKIREFCVAFNAHIDVAAKHSKVDWFGKQRLGPVDSVFIFRPRYNLLNRLHYEYCRCPQHCKRLSTCSDSI